MGQGSVSIAVGQTTVEGTVECNNVRAFGNAIVTYELSLVR